MAGSIISAAAGGGAAAAGVAWACVPSTTDPPPRGGDAMNLSWGKRISRPSPSSLSLKTVANLPPSGRRDYSCSVMSDSMDPQHTQTSHRMVARRCLPSCGHPTTGFGRAHRARPVSPPPATWSVGGGACPDPALPRRCKPHTHAEGPRTDRHVFDRFGSESDGI